MISIISGQASSASTGARMPPARPRQAALERGPRALLRTTANARVHGAQNSSAGFRPESSLVSAQLKPQRPRGWSVEDESHLKVLRSSPTLPMARPKVLTVVPLLILHTLPWPVGTVGGEGPFRQRDPGALLITRHVPHQLVLGGERSTGLWSRCPRERHPRVRAPDSSSRTSNTSPDSSQDRTSPGS